MQLSLIGNTSKNLIKFILTLILLDSTILISGSKGKLNIAGDGKDFTVPAIRELDFDGNTVWDYIDNTKLPLSLDGVMRDIEMDEDGNLYGVADVLYPLDSSLYDLGPNVIVNSYTRGACIYKWNADRELVYQKIIRHSGIISYVNTRCEVYDMTVDSTGSVIFTGFVAPDAGQGYPFGIQLWLVKTDTNGCVEGEPCIDARYLNVNALRPVVYELKGYPNPTTGTIYFKNNDLQSFRLLNLSGQLVQEGKFNNNQIEINQNLSNGSYFLQVQGRNKSYYQKMILRR